MFKELWQDVVVARGCAWSDFLENLVQLFDCEWLYSTTSLFAPVVLPSFVTACRLTFFSIGAFATFSR